MANNETVVGEAVTANSTAAQYTALYDGQFEVDIYGTWDTATVSVYNYSTALGRGSLVRAAATADDSFTSLSRYLEFVVTSVGGSTSLNIITRPLRTVTIG